MELKDKKITCKDCGKVFDFLVRDQKFYAENGYTNEPLRCKECRLKKKKNEIVLRKLLVFLNITRQLKYQIKRVLIILILFYCVYFYLLAEKSHKQD